MIDKKFEELIKKALETPPKVTITGEMSAKEAFVDAQENACGSCTTIMATDLDEQIGSRRSCINHFEPGTEVIWRSIKQSRTD